MTGVGDYLSTALIKNDEEIKQDDNEGFSQVKTKHVKPQRPVSSRKKPPSNPNENKYGLADSIFKESFEDIIEEIVELSKFVNHTYTEYKQKTAQTELKLKEIALTFQELATFKEKQIKQAEE